MDTPPHLKGPLNAVRIADDTVWVTKDGAWVIVGRRTWDSRASASPPPPPPAAPARKRPATTDDDMGLVMGTGPAMPSPRPAPAPRAVVHTEPVWVDASRDTTRLGLFAVGGVLLVALVLAVGVVTGMSLRAGATPEPVPVLQPVELTNPPVATSGARFRTPPPPVEIPEAVDTGDALATVAGSTVLLGRAVDDDGAKATTPRFVVPAMPPLPPGDKPRWAQRLATGWRALEAHPDRAAKQFRRVAAARPRLADAQLGLGVAFIRLGQPAEAVPRLCAAAADPVLAAAANGALDALGARCPQDR